jgi:hypothetical protein
MENRFASYTNRVAQNVLGNTDLTHERAYVESIAGTNSQGTHFSSKVGTDVFTIYVELQSRPGITLRVVGKGSIAREMSKVKKGQIIDISGKFNEGDAVLNAMGKLRRMPVIYLEGDLVKGIKAFQVVAESGVEVLAQ